MLADPFASVRDATNAHRAKHAGCGAYPYQNGPLLGTLAAATNARRILELAPRVPAGVWGRDSFGTGDMWNSNSLVAWLLASAGIAVRDIALPPRGRAPGWEAGIAVASSPGSA